MYTGRVVEESNVDEIFASPETSIHAGLYCVPSPKLTEIGAAKETRLQTIEGTVPSPANLPDGCHFAPRCPHRFERCTHDPMPLFLLETTTNARCV
jgi:oligopeptide/dipeptide ABC transporter ATP-binding protein